MVNGGAGNERISISGVTVGSANTAGSVTINTSSGNDNIDLSNLRLTGSSTTGGTVNIFTGAGNDNVNLSNLSLAAAASGATASRISVNTAAGNDHVSLTDSAADQLFADLGAGNDVLNANGALAFANQIQLSGNVGRDRLNGNAALSAAGNAIASLLGFESIV
jgi:hypothetical protein